MIRLQAGLCRSLDTPEALRAVVQQAVMLEHATIPAYLYALYSIKPGENVEIADLVLSVVLEEMSHMALASNLLNAIGGSPAIADPKFVPRYPGRLPGSVDASLVVPLRGFDLKTVQAVFMSIEEPEDPLDFPLHLADANDITIGQFYQCIRQQIVAVGKPAFVGDAKRQVTANFGAVDVTPVTDVDTALQAIETIVEQGEGTATSPLDPERDLAHYYRFAEIFHGRKLVPNPDAGPNTPPDQRYAYTGDPIPFDPAGVNPVVVNPTAAGYPTGSRARRLCDTFNYTYTSLLKSLHATFNGTPGNLNSAIGLMESCRQQALEMASLDLGNGTTAGPSFEYQPINP